MKITYYGHASFLMEIAGQKILVDPFISPNPNAAHINIDEIQCDLILVSHGHGDHIADVMSIAKRLGVTVVSNPEVIGWFQKQGLEKVQYLNFGGTFRNAWGDVKYTPALHSSSMPDGSYGGNPGGFVINTPEGTVFYSGDTCLSYDFKLIAEEFKIDLAILPIGDTFTMGAKEASKLAQFVQCNKVMGVHYDTFPAIVIDHAKAKAEFSSNGQELYLLEIGESRDF